MTKTIQELIAFADKNQIDKPKAFAIKIHGKFIKKDTYRGSKCVWNLRGSAFKALQLIVGDGAYKEKVNPVIEEYLKSGFIEIIEV